MLRLVCDLDDLVAVVWLFGGSCGDEQVFREEEAVSCLGAKFAAA